MGSDRRLSSQNGGIWIDRNPILNVGVSLAALFNPALIIFLEAPRSQGNPMIELYMVTDNAGFSDDDTSSVIDKEIVTDLGAWMNIDPGSAMGPLGHNPREQWQLHQVKGVGDALNSDRLDTRIANDYFLVALTCRIALICRFYIGTQKQTNLGNASNQIKGDGFGLLLRATRLPSSQAFECFDPYAIGNAQNASRNNLRYLLGMNGFLIVVPWKQDLQEIVTDLGYGPF
jgi:hypothetical protein